MGYFEGGSQPCVRCKEILSFPEYDTSYMCPSCGQVHPWGPPIESELFTLQHKWYKTKASKYLGKIYLVLVSYADKIYRKRKRNGQKISLSDAEVRIADACYQFILQYLQRDDFKISVSFGKYLRLKLVYVLHNRRKKQEDAIVVSYNALVENDPNSTELSSFVMPDTSDEEKREIGLSWESTQEKVLRFFGLIHDEMLARKSYRHMVYALRTVMMHLSGNNQDMVNLFLSTLPEDVRVVCYDTVEAFKEFIRAETNE